MQIGDGSRAAPGIARCDLVVANAFLIGAVEIVIARNAGFYSAIDESVAERVALPEVRHGQWAVVPVKFVGAVFLVFRLLEIGQHVFIGPAGIAQLTPVVVIAGLAPHIEQAIDR